MKRVIIRIIFLTVVGIALVAGCEEESQIDTRKSRLIVNENTQVKKALESCQKEIEKHKELVEKCLQEKKTLGEKIKIEVKGDIEELAENALKDFEEIARLREENERLKVEIAKLRRELEMHKGPAPLPQAD